MLDFECFGVNDTENQHNESSFMSDSTSQCECCSLDLRCWRCEGVVSREAALESGEALRRGAY
jgi:hypothetical protein